MYPEAVPDRDGKNEVVPRSEFALCVLRDTGAFFMNGIRKEGFLWDSVNWHSNSVCCWYSSA